MFWCSVAVTWLHKSTAISLDVKVVILKMCFCLLTKAKSSFLDSDFEDILKSLCKAVTTGIENMIQSKPWSEKRDGCLGLGINVRIELKVSSVVDACNLCTFGFRLFHAPIHVHYRCGTACFQRIFL